MRLVTHHVKERHLDTTHTHTHTSVLLYVKNFGDVAVVRRSLTFSLTSSETVRDSMRQDTAQLMMWNRVYITRVLVEDLTGGQKAQQSEQGAGPQQQHI